MRSTMRSAAFASGDSAWIVVPESAIDGVDDAAEFGKCAIADQLDDPAVVSGDGRIENNFAVPLQSRQGAGLVGSHQARIADHVGGEDCRKLAVDARLSHERTSQARMKRTAKIAIPCFRTAP